MEAEFELGVGLDRGVGVGKHGDEQVDEDDGGGGQVHKEDGRAKGHVLLVEAEVELAEDAPEQHRRERGGGKNNSTLIRRHRRF